MPTKVLLKRGVAGAHDFFFSRTALAQGHLDLGCWYGFQEVTLKKSITPATIDFDFNLSEGSYLVFEFNKNVNQLSGIRLSLDKRFKDLYLISSDEGEFIYTQALNVPSIKPNTWNRIKVFFGSDTATFYLNDELLTKVKVSLIPQQQIGFRGGSKRALVDNVMIHELNSPNNIKETFSNNNCYVFLACWVMVALLNLVVSRRWASLLVIGNGGLAVFLGLFLLFDFFYTSHRYYHVLKTREMTDMENKYWSNDGEAYVLQEIKDKYEKSASPNSIRVVFMGRSQTWGAGARNEAETFVRRIEGKLNSASYSNRNIECINAGISGTMPLMDLVDIYSKNLIGLKPQLTVISLSNKEPDPAHFSSALKRLVDLDIAQGIGTVFVLEGHSIERTLPERVRSIIEEVGRQKGIPIYDLQEYLAQNYEKGFIWWDTAHLTSFGQKLTADYLSDRIAHELLAEKKL